MERTLIALLLAAVVLAGVAVWIAPRPAPTAIEAAGGDQALVDGGYLERPEDHPLGVALLVMAGEDRLADLQAMRTDMGLPRPEPFDAGGDGSVNPPGTRYLMGAVWEIEAALDAGFADELTADVALNWTRCCWSSTDHWWYSELERDSRFTTNVNAQMAGAVQRLITERPTLFTVEQRGMLAEHADDAAARVVAEALPGPQWRYSERGTKLNDLMHFAYIAWGLATYRAHGGAVEIPWSNDDLAAAMADSADVGYWRAGAPGMRLAFAACFAPAYVERARADLYTGPYTFFRDQAHVRFGMAACH